MAWNPAGMADLPSLFETVYGRPPTHLATAPGRVNLIGEHTDYNALPAMPLAIERRIRIALRPRLDRQIHLANLDPGFAPRRFGIEPEIAPFPQGDWGNYAKAAVSGVVRDAPDAERGDWLGFDALVSGDIPRAAGLSSSSALVVCTALAFLAANGRLPRLDRAALAEQMARAEWYVGTQGGGMDQAVCLLGRAEHALLLELPGRWQPVRMPSDLAVAVAHSLVFAPKSDGARLLYNRRPIECRLAAALLAKNLGLPERSPAEPPWLLGELSRGRPELLKHALDFLGEDGWREGEIAAQLGWPLERLRAALLRGKDGRIFAEPEDGFQLGRRVRHALTEGARVHAALQALRDGRRDQVGGLMAASHASCRDDLGVSTPELDALVEVSKRHGAIGARLTGAGFGGCIVALVPRTILPGYLEGVWQDYYAGRDLGGRRREDVLFATAAGPGAAVEEIAEEKARKRAT